MLKPQRIAGRALLVAAGVVFGLAARASEVRADQVICALNGENRKAGARVTGYIYRAESARRARTQAAGANSPLTDAELDALLRCLLVISPYEPLSTTSLVVKSLNISDGSGGSKTGGAGGGGGGGGGGGTTYQTPEPASLLSALLGSGIALLTARNRRRRRGLMPLAA